MHREKVHDYLGIDIDCSEQVTVKEFMIKYLYSVIQESPEKLSTTTSTPESHHLFTVRNEGEPKYLLEDQTQDFHRMV